MPMPPKMVAWKSDTLKSAVWDRATFVLLSLTDTPRGLELGDLDPFRHLLDERLIATGSCFNECARSRGICTMKKPSKTAAELEASIKVEMEDMCEWPTDMAISVQPGGDSWKVKVLQEGSGDDADRREMMTKSLMI